MLKKKKKRSHLFSYLEKETVLNTWKIKIDTFDNTLLLFFPKYLARCGNRKNPALALKIADDSPTLNASVKITFLWCGWVTSVEVNSLGRQVWDCKIWHQKVLFWSFPRLRYTNLIFSAVLSVCNNVYWVVLWIRFHPQKSFLHHPHSCI